MKGYVYVLLNPLFPNYLKIGKTTKLAEERAKQIYNQAKTGIPTEYVVAYDVEVTDCGLVEKHVHQLLEKKRINQDREFFSVSLKEAVTTIHRVTDDLSKQHKIEFLNQSVKSATGNEWWRDLTFTWKQIIRNHLSISYNPSEIDILRAIHAIIEHSQDENLRKKIALFVTDKNCIAKLKKWYDALEKERNLFNSYLPYELTENELKIALKLRDINCLNQNAILDLRPLIIFKELEFINITNTKVSDLGPLNGLLSLKEIICNYTDIDNLDPLKDLPNLKKVTCYGTKLSELAIDSFRVQLPNCEIDADSFLKPTLNKQKTKI